ncbi:ABC transporter permease [Defluviimonas sp. SAOS-178_SWC]|uniref:ABC transporter permease n=1 Tax=Defluviimonas sp. SAOS-178_SWC TaxID=3121287 RepID=UPI0032221493
MMMGQSMRMLRVIAPITATLLLALVAICVLLIAVHVDVLLAARAFYQSTFGSLRTFGEVLVRSTPLLLIAATLLPSLRSGFYNIGAPGQVAAGGLAATFVALNMSGAPAPLALVSCAISAAVAGGLVSMLPGFLKARWTVNEIVSSLAMNFIMIAVLGYLLNGPMQSDFANLPQSDSLPANSSVPKIFDGTRAHMGVYIALMAIPLLILLDKSIIGYRLRVFYANQNLSRRANVNPGAYTIWMFVLAGTGAGLAGWMQVAAIDHRLYPGIAEPIGYAGLFVVFLGALHPVGIVLAAFALGALMHGGGSLQVGAGVSAEIVQVFLGVVLIVYAVMPRASGSSADGRK